MQRPASTSNQISYESYCQLGGCDNPDLAKIDRNNGSYYYTTYHHVGYGQAYWRNDAKRMAIVRILLSG